MGSCNGWTLIETLRRDSTYRYARTSQLTPHRESSQALKSVPSPHKRMVGHDLDSGTGGFLSHPLTRMVLDSRAIVYLLLPQLLCPSASSRTPVDDSSALQLRDECLVQKTGYFLPH